MNSTFLKSDETHFSLNNVFFFFFKLHSIQNHDNFRSVTTQGLIGRIAKLKLIANEGFILKYKSRDTGSLKSHDDYTASIFIYLYLTALILVMLQLI